MAYFTVTYLDVSFNRIMQLLSYVGVILILVFRDRNKPIVFPKYLLFYFLFILYVFYADLIGLGRQFKIEYLFASKMIGSFNIMFIIENSNYREKYYRSIVKISQIVIIIAVIVIVIQQLYSPSFFMRKEFFNEELLARRSTVRLYSIYSWFGSIFSAGFSFVPIFFIVFEDLIKRNKKILLWLMLGVIFVFLSKQRWIMLNFSLVFFILFISANYKNRIIKFFKFIMIVPMLILGVFIFLNIFGIGSEKILKERIFESGKRNLEEKSAGTRLLAFKAFNEFYWDNPILGVGNHAYGFGGTGIQDYKLRNFLKARSSQIHVGYLSLLYMYGLVGGVLFLSFLFLLLKKMYMNSNSTKRWAPFLGMMGLAINNLVDVNFQLFVMGLILSLVVDKYYSQSINTKLDNS